MIILTYNVLNNYSEQDDRWETNSGNGSQTSNLIASKASSKLLVPTLR